MKDLIVVLYMYLQQSTISVPLVIKKTDGKRDLYVAATRISPGSPINGTLKLNRELFLNDLIRCLFLPT